MACVCGCARRGAGESCSSASSRLLLKGVFPSTAEAVTIWCKRHRLICLLDSSKWSPSSNPC